MERDQRPANGAIEELAGLEVAFIVGAAATGIRVAPSDAGALVDASFLLCVNELLRNDDDMALDNRRTLAENVAGRRGSSSIAAAGEVGSGAPGAEKRRRVMDARRVSFPQSEGEDASAA